MSVRETLKSGLASPNAGEVRVVLGILEAAERGEARTQRQLAAHLGVAVGLVNAYVKRCVRKGWLKVTEAPARRYAYYLTPQGFLEKANLTAEYLSVSLQMFRKVRADMRQVLVDAEMAGLSRLVVMGSGELAEIVAIMAFEREVEIVAFINPDRPSESFLNTPVLKSVQDIPFVFDAIIISDPSFQNSHISESRRFAGPVLVPGFLKNGMGAMR